MGQIVIIALGTFKGSVRERVLYNLVVSAFLMIGAAILLGSPAGYLRGLPIDPSGEPYIMGPDGRAHLAPKSKVDIRLSP